MKKPINKKEIQQIIAKEWDLRREKARKRSEKNSARTARWKSLNPGKKDFPKKNT
jgi:hypothetical protein